MSNREAETTLIINSKINVREPAAKFPETALDLAIRRIVMGREEDAHRGFSSII
jgi:hypothetical protein